MKKLAIEKRLRTSEIKTALLNVIFGLQTDEGYGSEDTIADVERALLNLDGLEDVLRIEQNHMEFLEHLKNKNTPTAMGAHQ